MGNTRSEFFEPVSVDLWWGNDQTNTPEPEVQTKQNEKQKANSKANEDKMAEVREEISSLHEKRLRLIAEKKKEMDGLRREVARQKRENEELKEFLRRKGLEPPSREEDATKVDVCLQTETFEVPGTSNPLEVDIWELKTKVEELELELNKVENIKGKNVEMQRNMAELQKDLQHANSELAAFENERQEYKTHVTALKDIITVSKQLLLMRESQIKELSQKVAEIQASLAEREMQALSNDLRQEYEKQLQNIKQLRALYEERQRADKTQKDNLKSQLEETQSALKTQETKNSELQERIDELEKDNWNKYDAIINLESQLGLTKAECGELKAEMSVINQLFSQILLGFSNGQEIDLDGLIKTLEENHDLLKDIVINEESNELSSALPKVLLDLVSQVSEKTKTTPLAISEEEPTFNQTMALATIVEESESQTSTQQNSLSSASEIVQNLPKVWKVLSELLSHQRAPVSVLNANNEQGDKNPCYKSVQTPSGPTLVLSVSKTFIRLKNLIVEKKSLEKETTRLKQLNTHLETRLQDQEKRLGVVSHELSKTWNVVGKMQKQHQQLHTQEKILRYELAQKRKLLNELKEELEYCREKWLQAREKNSTTEEQWKQLRNEFAARKNTISEDLNNSAESGYSDERESSDDDIEGEAEPPIVNPDTITGCDESSGNLENKNAEVCKIIGKVVAELESNLELSNVEENSQTILKVIQDEIAKIENGGGPSGETSLAQPSEGVNDAGVTQKQKNFDETICDLPGMCSTLKELVRKNENLALNNAETSVTHPVAIKNVEQVQQNKKRSIGHDSSASCNPSTSSSPKEEQSAQLENNVKSSTTDFRSSLEVYEIVTAPPTLAEQTEDRTTDMELEKSEENVDELLVNSFLSSEQINLPQVEEEVEKVVLNELIRLENNIRSSRKNPGSTSHTVDGICQHSPISERIKKGTTNTELEEKEDNADKHLVKSFSSPEQTDLPQVEEVEKVVLKELIRLENNIRSSRKNLGSTSAMDAICQHSPILEEIEDATRNVKLEEIDQLRVKRSLSQQTSLVKLEDDGETYVLNEHGSTDKVHSRETLKTDLVQNKDVQKDNTIGTCRPPEEIFMAKEERLKRLEKQTEALMAQTANTSNRSIDICSKLDELHEQYGNDEKSRRKDIDDMYRKLEEDILQTIRKTQGGEEYPSTSRPYRSTEENLTAREERPKRLEEQSNELVSQAAKTAHKSNEISSELDTLHQKYDENNQNNFQSQPEAPQSFEETFTLEKPSTSSARTPEEILAGREERLRIMEEQAQQLVQKALRNSLRGFHFCRKLNKLHDRYGESSDSSDEGADDNNNNAGDGVQNGHETQNGNISVNSEAQLDLEEAEHPDKSEEQ